MSRHSAYSDEDRQEILEIGEALWPEGDAIFGHPKLYREARWPAVDYIVGNPPFLGHFPFREQLESWPETPVDLASGYTPGNQG